MMEFDTSTPLVLAEYLSPETGYLRVGCSMAKVHRGNVAMESRFRTKLKSLWFQGRCHAELARLDEVFERNGITNREIAASLEVSDTAVGTWRNFTKGIDPQNLELLHRFASDRLGQCVSLTDHERDLNGYIRAISRLHDTDLGAIDNLAVDDFWRLWFLLRNKSWRKYRCHEDSSNKVAQTIESHALSCCSAHNRRPVVSPLRELRVLESAWAPAFVTVVEYLDTACWTGPSTEQIAGEHFANA